MHNKVSERIHKHHLKRAKKQAQKRSETFNKTHGNLATRQAKNAETKPSSPAKPRAPKPMKNKYVWDEDRKCTVKAADAITQQAQDMGMYEAPKE